MDNAEIRKKEMADMSTIVTVNNITDEPYEVIWDSVLLRTIPANSSSPLPKPYAEHAVKGIVERAITKNEKFKTKESGTVVELDGFNHTTNPSFIEKYRKLVMGEVISNSPDVKPRSEGEKALEAINKLDSNFDKLNPGEPVEDARTLRELALYKMSAAELLKEGRKFGVTEPTLKRDQRVEAILEAQFNS